MTRHLSARARLTLLHTLLFAACGTILVVTTYVLLANSLSDDPTPTAPAAVHDLIDQCADAQLSAGIPAADARSRCLAAVRSGVQAGAAAQRQAALDQLLLVSLGVLAGVIAVSAIAGWIAAGRILRPVREITAAARAASVQNLSQLVAHEGPHDELHELAETFDQMLTRLDDAFASQRQFIANAGHELRTPLTMMRTSIDVVLAKPSPTNEELTDLGRQLRDAVIGAETLVGALLTLARTDHTIAVDDALDLATIVEDDLDDRPPSELTMRRRLKPAPVRGDPVLLARLVANLLDNAAQYNRPRGSIRASTEQANGVSTLRIVNTGPQVAPDDVDRLFLPFTRLNDRTSGSGFGLGLALVKTIAHAHGGSVLATSAPGGGLDVIVTLPSRDALDAVTSASVAPASGRSCMTPLRSRG